LPCKFKKKNDVTLKED